MPYNGTLLSELRSIPDINIRLVNQPVEQERMLPLEIIRDCHILFTTFLPTNHLDMKELKFVQIGSAGYTQLIGKGLPERGIIACNALGVFDVPIAEWNIAMMINMARDMKRLVHNQDNTIWDRSPRFQDEIRGKVVGIWGYGGIGRETARLAKALGMRVRVLTRNGISDRINTYTVAGSGDPEARCPDQIFTANSVKKFLRGLDFLILAMPLTKETEGIVGEAELRLLEGAFILNPARGPIIQEEALLRALSENWIAGAALDTHYHYPMPEDHPLWKMPNVLMTPHISGSSANPKFLDRVWDIFVQNTANFIEGKPLLNRLSDSQLLV